MAEKKNPGRFTIQFNFQDPQQQAAADYLERQSRHKAQFLTSAILHYLHCPETPDIPQQGFPSRAELEKLVLSILQEHRSVAANTFDGNRNQNPNLPQDIRISEIPECREPVIQQYDRVDSLGEAEMSAILKTLSDFNRT